MYIPPLQHCDIKSVIPRLTQGLDLKWLPTKRALYYLGCIKHYFIAYVVRLWREHAAIWDAASSLAAK